MGILIFGILIIVFIISIPVYFDYQDKKTCKEYEKSMNKNDTYKEEVNIEKDSEYHSWNDPYYSSKYWSGPHTSNHTSNHNTYDPTNDPMSPCCPWGYWSM